MLKYREANEDGVVVDHILSRPTIYLDQFAWNHLATQPNLKSRFIEIAQQQEATLMYSRISYLELTTVDDPTQLAAITEIMDAVNYAFFQGHAPEVIDWEEQQDPKYLSQIYKCVPILDEEHARDFILKVSNPLKPLKISDALINLRNAYPKEHFQNLALGYENELTPAIQRLRENPEHLKNAKQRLKNRREVYPLVLPATKSLHRMEIDYVATNETKIMTRNDWVDFMSMAVPVSYFDFVFLDGHWYHFLNQVAGFKHPHIAKVYKKNQFEQFLEDLKGFQLN